MPSPLSKAEVKRLRHYAQEGKHGARNAALVEVLLSGARCKEGCSVSINEAIDNNGEVKEKIWLAGPKTKSGKGRYIFLTNHAREVIQYYWDCERSKFPNQDKSLPLFRSQKDPHKPLGSKSGQAIVKDCFRKANIDGGSHRCRATFITNLSMCEGITISQLCLGAGHQHVSSTARYLSYSTKPIEEAMKTLKF